MQLIDSQWKQKRLLDVLNQHLAKHEYLAGTEYSIADIAAFP